MIPDSMKVMPPAAYTVPLKATEVKLGRVSSNLDG